MTIPATESFEAFLSQTKLVREKPETSFVIFGGGAAGVADVPLLYLSYPDMELKLGSVLDRLQSELKSMGCAVDDSIALATLGLVCETQVPGESCVDHANRCLATTHVAKLHQVVVLPSHAPPRYKISRSTYSLEEFDPQRLLYWSKRGGSSYPVNLKELSGRLCVKRDPQDVKIIDWDRVPGLSKVVEKWGVDVASISILDEYYQSVAHLSLQKLPTIVKDDLVVLEAGALMHVDINRLLSSIFADYLGLFTWHGSAGHRSWAFMGSQKALHLNLFPEALYSKCVAWLEDEFGFRDLSEVRPIDATIRTYSRFLQRAHQHRLEGRHDEAFLHFVIALDLLLGLEGRSTENVCKRAGFLVHRQLGKSLQAQTKSLKKLYDARSKYVHEGKPTSSDDLHDVERVCVEILWNLLAASRANSFDSGETWLNQVDYLIASINASRPISETEMETVGIPKAGHARQAPNRVTTAPNAEFFSTTRMVAASRTQIAERRESPIIH